MPQSDRTVVLSFDADEWAMLEREAFERGRDVRDAVYQATLTHLIVPRRIEEALEPPPGEWTIDGEIADQHGAIAMEAAAQALGRRIKAEGGKRHDGRVFKPKGAE